MQIAIALVVVIVAAALPILIHWLNTREAVRTSLSLESGRGLPEPDTLLVSGDGVRSCITTFGLYIILARG